MEKRPNRSSNHRRTWIFVVVSAFLCWNLILPGESRGQITYMDIDPDTTLSTNGATFDLDLNLDEQADFRFLVTIQEQGAVIDMQTLHDSAIAAIYYSDCVFAKPFELNDSLAGWSPYENYPESIILADFFTVPSYCLSEGPFIGAVDKYIGLGLLTNNDTCFGWLRVDVSSEANQITLKDYAISCTDNILAGQVTLAIGSKKMAGSPFTIRESASEIIVSSRDGLVITGATLFNTLSQPGILPVTDREICINKSWNRPGIYILQIKTDKGIFPVKLLLKNN